LLFSPPVFGPEMMSVYRICGAPFTATVLAAFTVIENADREAVEVPSLTEITIPEVVPAEVGVPASAPVVLLKVAQLGLLVIE